jgi:hypothetical protein
MRCLIMPVEMAARVDELGELRLAVARPGVTGRRQPATANADAANLLVSELLTIYIFGVY